MLLTPILTLAFVCCAALLNLTLASDSIEPEFFSLSRAERNEIFGMAGDMRDASLALLGFRKLPEAEEKPKAPVPAKPEVAGIKVAARSAVAVDCQSNDVIFEQAAQEKWPIASITKLMTALVFLDYNPGWDKIYQIRKDDRRDGGRIYLYAGEKVKIKDIFYTSLTASDNTATVALVHSTGMTEAQFVEKMNERAKLLGMVNTSFQDATGLKPNESTAEEIAKFANIALENEDIRAATLKREYRFKTQEGKEKTIPSTDQLLKERMEGGIEIAGGKTGYTDEAGYCFVGRFVQNGHELVTVVLGTPSVATRFSETNNLVKWIFSNFKWENPIAPEEKK